MQRRFDLEVILILKQHHAVAFLKSEGGSKVAQGRPFHEEEPVEIVDRAIVKIAIHAQHAGTVGWRGRLGNS